MKKILNIGVTLLVVLLVASIAFFALKGKLTSSTITPTSTEIAKWIGEHSVLYIKTGCSHCKTQEDMFGDNIKYLNIIDGAKKENEQKFIDAGINLVPTWVINGEQYAGTRTIEELKNLTGYS